MSKKHNETQQDTVPYTGRTYAYIAIALTALSALAIGLSFTVLGIYSLISAVLLSLASLTFVNVQKKKNDFPKLKIINICAYTVLGICLIIFTGGIIWSAIK